MSYTVYILKCADQTLYTGCTNDFPKRLREHSGGAAGAKYTRGRRPVQVVYTEDHKTLAQGRKREAEIKRLTRSQKIAMTRRAPLRNNARR